MKMKIKKGHCVKQEHSRTWRGRWFPKFGKNYSFSGSEKKTFGQNQNFSGNDMKNVGKIRNFRAATTINCKKQLPNLAKDLFFKETKIE